jgi:hypothetical protein
MFGFPSAKRAKQKGGGPIVGQGTGTSDSIQKHAPVGSFIMPADSTAAIGHDGLAKLGLSKKNVPISVSNGEHELPPEQVHAVGVQALRQMKDATHTPVAEPDRGPQQFFANGDEVLDPSKKKQTSFDITNTPSAQLGIRNAQSAAAPAIPTPGNPAGGAQTQTQFDQPVTAGSQPQPAQPVAAGVPSNTPRPYAGDVPTLDESGSQAPRLGTSRNTTPVAQDMLQGAANLPVSVVRDFANIIGTDVRNFTMSGIDAKPIPSPGYPQTQAAYDQMRTGAGQLAAANNSLIGNAKAGAREALDVEADPSKIDTSPAPSSSQPAASNPYTGKDFEQWSRKQAAPASTPSFDASTSPAAASADKQDNGYRMIGTDAERGLDPGIAVKVGADGVPMFTNDKQAIAGAGGDFVASGFPRAQQSTPAGQMVAPAGSRVLASGTNAPTEAQQFAQLGSVRNLNNGIGTFSQAESGDAQLAYDRNERAIAERYKMNDISRRGEIGEGGGRVTVVRDSSRAPSIAETLRDKQGARLAQTEALRSGAQLGFNRDAREDAQLDLDRQRLGIDRQKGEIEAQAAQIGLQASQRLNQIRAQLANPALPADQRAQLEQAYAMLTIDAKDRYMTVVGGENEAGAKQASTVFDRITRQAVGGTATVTSAQVDAKAKESGKSREQVIKAMAAKGITING